jgi:hypothetical protein
VSSPLDQLLLTQDLAPHPLTACPLLHNAPAPHHPQVRRAQQRNARRGAAAAGPGPGGHLASGLHPIAHRRLRTRRPPEGPAAAPRRRPVVRRLRHSDSGGGGGGGGGLRLGGGGRRSRRAGQLRPCQPGRRTLARSVCRHRRRRQERGLNPTEAARHSRSRLRPNFLAGTQYEAGSAWPGGSCWPPDARRGRWIGSCHPGIATRVAGPDGGLGPGGWRWGDQLGLAGPAGPAGRHSGLQCRDSNTQPHRSAASAMRAGPAGKRRRRRWGHESGGVELRRRIDSDDSGSGGAVRWAGRPEPESSQGARLPALQPAAPITTFFLLLSLSPTFPMRSARVRGRLGRRTGGVGQGTFTSAPLRAWGSGGLKPPLPLRR